MILQDWAFMSNEKLEIVPKLRFPEFGGKWQKKRFSETCKFVRGPFGGALKKDIFVKDGYAVYEQSHAIHQNFDSFRYYITAEKFNKLKRFSVCPKDIIMSCSGTMGKFAIIPKEYKKGVINQALLKLTVNGNQNLKFIKLILELPVNQEKLLSQSAGGAIKNVVSVGWIKEMILYVPNITEQQKIATCLSSLDELITLQTQKIESLKTHKKGLMQKIFSQEIRFKADDGRDFPKWKYNKLGDIFYGKKGQGLSKSDIDKNGQNKCILYGELYTKYSETIDNVVSRTNLNIGVKSKAGDLLVPCSTTTTNIDLANATAINENNVLLGGDISILRFKKNGSSIFFSYYLTHTKKLDLAKYGQGSTIVHLYYNHFKKMSLCIPDIEEQQKIADYLTSLDELINVQAQKIDSLKTHKKGLMQQLFPK